ncbi:polyprenyl synthetase family protein, partial [Candidatus Woesearchaeota archaeon]|nr:polyprenyl synthetase family protein [Candidatus Woesearchaeota archaeon]
MNAIKQLENLKQKIDRELRLFFEKRITEAAKIDVSAKEMMEFLRDYSLRGGKRIRVAMIYYGYRCFRKNKEKELLKAAICMELIQSSFLIHDDIIDCDDLRRGGLTLHKSYEKKYKNKHFGESMAIIAGDLILTLANQTLAYSDFNKKDKLKAISKLNQVIHKVIYGQALDILSGIKKSMNEKDVLNIHYLKTASYTVEGPLHIGALLAGAKQKDLDVLSEYAVRIGKAFQIQDDILGLFADAKKLGKPIGSDIKQGKKTLLILRALENGTKAQKAFIKKHLGNEKIKKKDIEKFRKIIKDTGALE